MKAIKCKVCKGRMNIYWFGDKNKLNSYYRSYVNIKVLGIATCPKCYHMEDVMDIEGESEAESGPK